MVSLVLGFDVRRDFELVVDGVVGVWEEYCGTNCCCILGRDAGMDLQREEHGTLVLDLRMFVDVVYCYLLCVMASCYSGTLLEGWSYLFHGKYDQSQNIGGYCGYWCCYESNICRSCHDAI